MLFSRELVPGRLVRRYKRFLADVRLDSGATVTVHCPNTGAMLGCDAPDSRVWLSVHDNPKRKYRHTWELVETERGVLVGIHSRYANALIEEAIGKQVIGELEGYDALRREAVYAGGRFDFLLGEGSSRPCYVEVKSVTAVSGPGIGIFPDARSVRGARHLHDLIALKAQGYRAVMCYCVQRDDVTEVRPAVEIDPAYGAATRAAKAAGVELIACRCRVSPQRIEAHAPIPVTVTRA